MTIWQADFYRRPLQNEQGQPLWELVVCSPDRAIATSAFCPQPQANSVWIAQQLQQIANLPTQIQVFRPQSLSLIEAAGRSIGISVEPTRHTPTLKQLLQERSIEYRQMAGYTKQPYDPLAIEKSPPEPIPDNLQGEQWRFATLPARDLLRFQDRPIPVRQMPSEFFPLQLGLASNQPIPGVVIDGGRRSLQLARWIEEVQPVSLNFIAGDPDGLILEAGLADRWIMATFHDAEVNSAAQSFATRQQNSRGLHFLLVQPDDSGMTYSGFWLLKRE